jgi:hypothetical protein
MLRYKQPSSDPCESCAVISLYANEMLRLKLVSKPKCLKRLITLYSFLKCHTFETVCINSFKHFITVTGSVFYMPNQSPIRRMGEGVVAAWQSPKRDMGAWRHHGSRQNGIWGHGGGGCRWCATSDWMGM